MPLYGGVELGNWVPSARAQRIGEVGVDPEYDEMMQLNAYALAHPEARTDTMRKYYEAMNRWGMKGNQYEQEAKQLTEDNMKRNARQLYESNPGPGSGGFGLAQQIAGAVLANQAESIIGARQGRIMLPAGNALETLDGMDLPVSEGLRRYASTSDALSQFSYNPDNVFDPKNFGFGYNSMGIGGNNTAPVAYGGDGENYFRQEMYQRGLENANQNRLANIEQANQNRRNPLGSYQGASPEYIANIPSWNKFPKNYGGPGATNGSFGDGSQSMPGMSLTNGPDNKPMWTKPDALQDWGALPERKQNPKPFDPTVPSADYQPKRGDGAGYRQERNSNPYFDNHGGRSLTFGAMQPAFGVAQAPKIQRNNTSFGQTPPASSGPKPFGGSLSPDWTSYDISTGELFGRGYTPFTGRPSSSFDRWQTDPYTAGQISAFMR